MATSNVDIILRARDEATATLNRLTGSMESLTASVKRFTASIGVKAVLAAGVFAASVGAAVATIANMAVKLADQVEQLDNLSASSGIATDKLQVLQFAFRQGGVDAGALTQGLSFMTRAMENNSEKLTAMGVTSRDTFTAFIQLARIISSTEDVAKRNALAFEIFGRGGIQLIPVLNDLATKFDGVERAARRAGQVLSQEQIERLNALDRSVDRLTASLDGLSKRGLVAVAGSMGPVIDKFNALLDVVSNLNKYRWLIDWAVRSTGATVKIRTGGPDTPTVEGIEVKPGPPPNPAEWMPNLGTWGTDTSSGVGPRTDIASKLGIGRLVEEVQPVLDEAAKAFLAFSDSVRGAFDEIGRHVYSGFYTVLTNLTNKMQTFSSAMKTIWQSIVSGVLSAMAQLVSSAITAAFLKLLGLALTALTGMPVFAMAGDWAAGRVMGSGSNVVTVAGGETMSRGGSASFSPGPAGGASMAGGRGGDTFYIQTFSSKDLLTSLVSPRGELRGANSRLIEIAAAS